MSGKGKRTSLAALAGQKVDDVPGRSDPLLLTLSLAKLVPTRFNPRRNFGTDDDLRTFGLVLKKRQLQPAVVVSRAAYLKLWPDEAESVGNTPYVIANGERRFRASKAVGLETLNVVHNEAVAASRADFLDAVLSENNDREDLDPIERALGIETMVKELGGADKVADHYGKSKGWVSQQRALLKLAPDLQDLVSAGEMPIRVARSIAKLPSPEEQRAEWDAEQTRRAEPKTARPTTQAPSRSAAAPQRQAPTQAVDPVPSPRVEPREVSRSAGPPEPDPRFTAVNQAPEQSPSVSPPQEPAVSPGADPVKPSGFTAVNPEEPSQADGQPNLWDDWESLAEEIAKRLPPKDLGRLTVRLMELDENYQQALQAGRA
ncbi:ParB/RepB/Spo0J family partition protein [Streptomyces albidoflavus]|uniref:ParB/RepB/Spo0J family partition protein n=1 Tax=Streptomyces albidoflavus TaxID=1886 RepID=UPI003319D10A